MNIKDKLEEQLKTANSVTLDSDTFKQPAEEPKGFNISTTSEVPISDAIKNDPLFKSLDAANISKTLTEDMKSTEATMDKQMDVIADKVTATEKVEITAGEKSSFITAMVTNCRYIRPFSLLNGAISGEFRSRTQEESFAIFQQLNHELVMDKLETQLSYSIRLRNMFLTTQVKRINNFEMIELQSPLLTVVNGTETIAPTWLPQVDYWNKQNEAFVNILYKQLRTFEIKYLTMIENAEDQNFWKTAPSI